MLPLLAGIAVGAGAVIAINNRKELKEKVSKSAQSVKESVTETVECLKSKKDSEAKEEAGTEKAETKEKKKSEEKK